MLEWVLLNTAYTIESFANLPMKHKLFIKHMMLREIEREKGYRQLLGGKPKRGRK